MFWVYRLEVYQGKKSNSETLLRCGRTGLDQIPGVINRPACLMTGNTLIKNKLQHRAGIDSMVDGIKAAVL